MVTALAPAQADPYSFDTLAGTEKYACGALNTNYAAFWFRITLY